MSAEFALHAAGFPPAFPGRVPEHCEAVSDTHWPEAVSQTSPFGHCESIEHLPHRLGPPAPQIVPLELVAQSALLQQLPGTQALPLPLGQQKSAGLTQAWSAVVHVEDTQREVDVLQMKLGPYVGSVWHWLSSAQPPQALAAVTPQICPELQFASEVHPPLPPAPPDVPPVPAPAPPIPALPPLPPPVTAPLPALPPIGPVPAVPPVPELAPALPALPPLFRFVLLPLEPQPTPSVALTASKPRRALLRIPNRMPRRVDLYNLERANRFRGFSPPRSHAVQLRIVRTENVRAGHT